MKSKIRTGDMREKILIVEDEPDVATYLATVLQTHGYSPTVADNADSGLRIARETQPDLICLDIMMPRKTGLTMYTQLMKDSTLKDTPVLIISGVEHEGGFDFRAYVQDESIPPPSHHMEKPINIHDYLRIVRRLIASNRTSRRRASHGAT
jgi:CheY-like chemotaxis protein